MNWTHWYTVFNYEYSNLTDENTIWPPSLLNIIRYLCCWQTIYIIISLIPSLSNILVTKMEWLTKPQAFFIYKLSSGFMKIFQQACSVLILLLPRNPLGLKTIYVHILFSKKVYNSRNFRIPNQPFFPSFRLYFCKEKQSFVYVHILTTWLII